MAYCTQANILSAISLRALASMTGGTGGAVDTTVLTDAIKWADAQIDAALDAQYTVPLTTVPELVKWLSVDLALYFLGLRGEEGLDSNINTRGERALKLLEKVSSGEKTIPGLAASSDWVQLSPSGAVPIFSMSRVDDNGNTVSSPETGTLDNY